MKAWLRTWRIESRLLWTNPVLLSIALGYGLWFAFILSRLGPPSSEDIYRAVYGFHEIWQTLSLGLAMWLGIWLMRRDVMRPSYEWLAALPVSRAGLIGAKYLAGLLYLSLFTILVAVVFAYFGRVRELPWHIVSRHLGFFAIQDEWSYMVTLALAMFLAVVIPGRLVYLIGFCAWVFGTFFLEKIVIGTKDWYFLKTFHLNQWFGNDYIVGYEAWGYPLISREIALSRVFVVVFALWLVVSAMVRLAHRWPSTRRKMGLAAAAVLFGVSGVAYVPYGLWWKDRYDTRGTIQQWTPQEQGATAVHTSFPVQSYSISVDRAVDDRLTVVANLTLRPQNLGPGQTVTFTLNRLFQIDRVTVDGQEVAVSRDVDHFSLPRAAFGQGPGPVTVRVRYSGKVYDWLTSPGERFAAFVRGNDVYLPYTQGWYPLPGKETLKIREPSYIQLASPNDLELQPADFRVVLRGFEATVFANVAGHPGPGGEMVFSGGHLDGVSLFGGTIIQVQAAQGGTSVICSPSNSVEARRFAAELDLARSYVQPWLNPPTDRVRRVVYLPVPPLGAVGDLPLWPAVLSGDSFLTGETHYHNLDEYRLAEVVSAWLYGIPDVQHGFWSDPAGEGPGRDSVTRDIGRALVYVVLREGVGLPSGKSLAAVGGLNDVVRQPIDQALAAGQSEKVRQVLKGFYDRVFRGATAPNANLPAISVQQWQEAWRGTP
ncbi:ABC transporter permease [Kyrpidia spormannii]|uniref:Uncharacterized protein n=1 Tax=Kyrpidia spormannii TaxID=2055160 RepID=A0ACA8Z7H8_9BACL|nr:hypothetical protein [Kyrpidia spormannii]CAB3390057.1 conserved membrane protein of unknown function [Kyrpidia spormannii]